MRKPIINIGLRGTNESDDAALNRLRRQIESGHLPVHSRLPPERDLARQLTISRARLRKALEVFEAEGLIWRNVGQGTFVGSRPPPANAPAMLETSNISPKEVIDARLVVEPAVAAYAASTARPSDIKQLRHCAARREAALEAEAYNLWDRKFHLAIAEASQNPIFISLFERLNVLRSAPTYRRNPMHEPYRSISACEHQAIITAIADRNPVAAYHSMRTHIASVQATFYSWLETEVVGGLAPARKS
jgi:DNA-binding FadR family transcriptional regulator